MNPVALGLICMIVAVGGIITMFTSWKGIMAFALVILFFIGLGIATDD